MIRHLIRTHYAIKDPQRYVASVMLRQERERELEIKAANREVRRHNAQVRKQRNYERGAQDRAIMADLKEREQVRRAEKRQARQVQRETLATVQRRRKKDRDLRRAASKQARRARAATATKRDALGRFSGSSSGRY